MGAMMVIIILIATISSLLSITHTAPLTFNYTNFDQCSDDVKLAGDATCVKSGVQVTGFQYYTAGQAQYSKPMRLWDAATGNLTNFTSTFTFTMDNDQGDWTCDGMAFFIASFNRTWPGTSANTGLLGLMHGNHTYNATDNPFVAVEFDTYNNPDWDVWSNLSHVGVDINSIQSVASKRWKSYSDGTTTMWGQVSYNAGNLCASFTGLTENLTEVPRDSLCYEVDLRNYLAEWAVVGFSGSTAWRYQSHTLKSWSFVSDLDAEGGPTTTTGNSNNGGKKKKSKTGLIVGGGVAAGILVVFAIALIKWCLGRPGKNQQQYSSAAAVGSKKQENSNNIPGVSFISPQDLRKATKDFNMSEYLGRGGYGVVYKAQFGDQVLAVKKLPNHKNSDFKGYVTEMSTISQLNHDNLVKLRGWSCDDDQGHFYLIYEYMENSSLDRHLQGSDQDNDKAQPKVLDWPRRYRIAKDVATGLSHLHEGKDGRSVLHRDIKPSNVLLDSNFNAKLADFGLARVVDQQAVGAPQTVPGYTPWYVAPECVGSTGKSTEKSDVYSFGLVVLEIACGGRKQDIAKWVSELNTQGDIMGAADSRLLNEGSFRKAEMESLLMVGLHCAHPKPDQRPSMSDALQALKLDMAADKFRAKYPAPTPEDYLYTPPTAPQTIELSGPSSNAVSTSHSSGGGGGMADGAVVGSESPSPLLANIHLGGNIRVGAAAFLTNPTLTAPNDGGQA